MISCGQAKDDKSASALTSNVDKSSTEKVTSGNSANADELNASIKNPIKGGPANIELTVEGVNGGACSLIGFYAEQHFRIDSTSFQGNNVSFKRSEGFPQGIYYVSLPSNQYVQLILSEDQEFKMQLDEKDIVSSMKVEGSVENQIFYENLRFESEFSPKYSKLTNALKGLSAGTPEYEKQSKVKAELESDRKAHLDKIFKNHPNLLFTKFKKAGQNPIIREGVSDQEKVYHYRMEFWDNVDLSDSRLIRTPVISNKLTRYIKELTPQNHDSIFKATKHLVDRTLEYPEYFKFFTNWITIQYEPTKCTLMDPEYVFVNMIQNYFTRERAFWADSMEVYALQNRSMEMSQSLLGSKGPNVVSKGPAGETKALFDSEAEYLVVYMYNPTCEHCAVQTPELVKWYNKNKNNGRDVYAIAIDTDAKEWNDYISKNNMNFTNVFDPSNRSIYAKYYVDITPEIYVLNKERVIIGKNLKVFQIDTIIQQHEERSK